MEAELLGWPENDPRLELDHERFSYAGKFVMTSTGKAVGREAGEVVAAAAFNEDRTDPDALWIRYITVRADRRGEGLGPELAAFVRDRARERGYDRVRIAVNNPYAYEALHRAGFGYTGDTTGIAELVLQWPADRAPARYRAGLDEFVDRELSDDEHAFVRRRRREGPPTPSDT
jgi:GNAT superfamily N-acetyltransferase